MQMRSIGTAIAAFVGAVIVAAVAYAQPGLSFNKDTTIQGTGTVASPIGVNTTTLAGTGLVTSGAGLAVGCGTGLTCAADSLSISSSVATTSGCSTGTLPVHSSTSGLGCSQWLDDGTTSSYMGTGGLNVDDGSLSSGANAYLILTSSFVGTRSVIVDDDLVVEGNNSNDHSGLVRAALDIVSGRDSSHALNSGQTTGDIAIQSGADDGGFRHFISSKHSATAASNALRFWVNTGATSEDSSAPGTGNVNVMDMYGDGSTYFPGAMDASGGIATTTIVANGTVSISGSDNESSFANANTIIDPGSATGNLYLGQGITSTGDIFIGGGGDSSSVIKLLSNTEVTGTLTATTTSSTFGDLRGTALVYTTPTGTQTVTLSASTTIVRFNASVAIDLVGLTGGADGRIVLLENKGTANVTLFTENGSASAANRFAVGSGILANGGGLGMAWYDGTSSRWRAHFLMQSQTPAGLTVNGALVVTSTAQVTSTLAVNGNVTLGDANTDTHTANGDLSVTDDLTVTDVTTLNGVNAFGDANTDTHTFNGHIHTTGTDPTLSSCGTNPSVIGSDTAGTVTIGTGGTASACTITFANAFSTNAPACVITSQMNAAISLYVSASSTSAITITNAEPPAAFPASGKFSYHCIGVP